MELIFSLLQQLSVYLVIAYLLSKTPLFMPIITISSRIHHRFIYYILFSVFCIMGTHLGLSIDDAVANTRAIGAVLGGLLGGPLVGVAVGLTGGLHRYTMGGFTDLACAISTTMEGLLAGLFHSYYINKRQINSLYKPQVVFGITVIVELMQMLIILIVAKPFDQALELVKTIALPMIIANSFGAALFMGMIQDRKTIYEKYSAAFSTKALKIAHRCVGILSNDFNKDSTAEIAKIIYEETGVGAVAITDRDKILAFIGIGEDHHLPNTPISSKQTILAIKNKEVIYADGYEVTYQCTIDPKCKLGSTLVIPLLDGNNEVIGTIKLYEQKQKLFSSINRSLGEGIGKLLSNQILMARYIVQQNLLVQAELRVLQAQVNPHFLFNALNTISAVIRSDPSKARELIQNLSKFFRSNLKQNIENVTIQDELQHVNSYLEIEKARFSDRLKVEINVSDDILDVYIPTFTLQPLVENAIKHGTSSLFVNGLVQINGFLVKGKAASCVTLEVIDNAGLLTPDDGSTGIGLKLVDQRIKNKYGQKYGLSLSCEKNIRTVASITFPYENRETGK